MKGTMQELVDQAPRKHRRDLQAELAGLDAEGLGRIEALPFRGMTVFQYGAQIEGICEELAIRKADACFRHGLSKEPDATLVGSVLGAELATTVTTRTRSKARSGHGFGVSDLKAAGSAASRAVAVGNRVRTRVIGMAAQYRNTLSKQFFALTRRRTVGFVRILKFAWWVGHAKVVIVVAAVLAAYIIGWHRLHF
jgi:hypothetical protein